MEHMFDDLISAVHNSIITANQIAEGQHISLLESYFDENHSPLYMETNLPFHDPRNPDGVTYKSVKIPKLSLVPISSLKMKEIEINFEVKFTQLMRNLAEEDANEKSNLPKGLFSFNNSSKNGFNDMAKITIKFEGTDPPEGIMRINEHLVKLLP